MKRGIPEPGAGRAVGATGALAALVERFDVTRVRKATQGVVLLDAVEREGRAARLLVVPERASSGADAFAQRARRVARWAHAAHARVLSVEDAGARPFAVLQAPAGESLARALETRTFAPHDALRVGIAIAEALAAAHEAGFAHGSLDADDVVLEGGGDAVVLLGAGLWPAAGDARADDQRAVARILYMLVSGHVLGDAARVDDAPTHLPPPLFDALARAMSPRPAARFPELRDFVVALGGAHGSPPPFDDGDTEAISRTTSSTSSSGGRVRIVRILGLCATPPPCISHEGPPGGREDPAQREAATVRMRMSGDATTIEDDPAET